MLTAWRTACASALAALVSGARGCVASRDDRRGRARAASGARACERAADQARHLWNRTRSRAVQTAFGLAVGGLEVEVTDDLEAAVREADIVSCATLSADAAGARQVAEEGRACRSGRRLYAEDARGRRRRDQARARLCRHPRRRARRRRRHRAAAEVGRAEEDRHPRRPVRALPRRGQGPHARRPRSRCSSRSAPRSRIWPPRCWCGGYALRKR